MAKFGQFWGKLAYFTKFSLQMGPLLPKSQPVQLFFHGDTLKWRVWRSHIQKTVKEEHKKGIWEDLKGYDCFGSWKFYNFHDDATA